MLRRIDSQYDKSIRVDNRLLHCDKRNLNMCLFCVNNNISFYRSRAYKSCSRKNMTKPHKYNRWVNIENYPLKWCKIKKMKIK